MTDLIQLAIPAFILLMVAEAVFDALMRRDLYEPKDTAASLTMGMGNVLVGLVSKGMVFVLFTAIHRFAIFPIGYHWWAWVLAFFADDFSYYWFHRTSHECRFFWASHVVHHSSQRYNLSTALRQTWTGGFFGFVFWLWMPLVGFQPIMIFTMQAISLLYQFWIHTEVVKHIGALELVMNSPSHHRVHHATNPAVHRPQSCRNVDHLGPHFREFRAGAGTLCLRTDREHQYLQPSADCVSRMDRYRAGLAGSAHLAGTTGCGVRQSRSPETPGITGVCLRSGRRLNQHSLQMKMGVNSVELPLFVAQFPSIDQCIRCAAADG